MNDDGAPSGERFIPEAMGGQLIEAEHQVRYRHAMQLVKGKAVLDAGCGVGWGTTLLAGAGAASVVGLDIDASALVDASSRTDDASFVRGDLMKLPFADGRFDVIVCFEAIEHVPDPFAALDELRRVLADDGVLTISSPNPGIYPAGNPFHIHEFPPDELQRELLFRFGHATAFQQHPLLASVVRDERDPDTPWATISLAQLSMPEAMYSVFDASDVPIEVTGSAAVLVSGRQFTGLVEMVESHQAELDHLGTKLQSEIDRVVADAKLAGADRDHYRAELDRTLLLLMEAEQELARRQQRE
jgi:ubiquinone/menaquinone biosynthesis C-methylase UbiE